MEELIKMSNLLSRCRCALGDGERSATLNEVMILEVLKKNPGRRISDMSRILYKDRAYLGRVLKKLIESEKVAEEENSYYITLKGAKTYMESITVIREIMSPTGEYIM